MGIQELVVNLRIAGPDSLMEFIEEHIEACRTVRALNEENRRLKAEVRRLSTSPAWPAAEPGFAR